MFVVHQEILPLVLIIYILRRASGGGGGGGSGGGGVGSGGSMGQRRKTAGYNANVRLPVADWREEGLHCPRCRAIVRLCMGECDDGHLA